MDTGREMKRYVKDAGIDGPSEAAGPRGMADYLRAAKAAGLSLAGTAVLLAGVYGCGTPKGSNIRIIHGPMPKPTYQRVIIREQPGHRRHHSHRSHVRDYYINPSTGTIIERKIVREALEGDGAAKDYIDTKLEIERRRIKKQYRNDEITREEWKNRRRELDALEEYLHSR